MVFRAGDRLKNRPYEIKKELGTGGFGSTYKAWHLELEYYVVLKTPNAKLQHDGNYQKYLERFKKEGRRLAQLSQVPHSHIVRITDFFTEGDLPCLVMDYIPGDSLYNLVQEKGKLSEEKAVEYIKQICSALTVCHEAGIIHRDAHPGNMMLREDNGNVVLIDFGIAKNVGTQSMSHAANIAFASWEQILGEQDEEDEDEDEVNLRELLLAPTIDVYTLAASLYYLVTAKTPTPSLARKYSGRKLKLPTKYNPEISSQLEEAIIQGMTLSPQKRPSSVKAWLDLFPKDVPLLTEVGVDYTKLRDLLAAGKWKEANEETDLVLVMLRAADPEEYDSLIEYVLLTDFTTDLSTIDQLWVKYSSGRFGFSVQRRIWESLGGTWESLGEIWEWDYEIAIKLGVAVGWRRWWGWIDYKDLVFDINASQGHLPCPNSFIQHFELLFDAYEYVHRLDENECTDYYDYR
ncbi:MAG: GUN4 domain-containing protein [Prochloron sp. SP5CPC1]|nr:GUN4 domain-containing protein [Candidatus Paraprochloron terpiosi SP5CPC1]